MDHVRKMASSEIRDDPTSHVRRRIKERVGLDLRPEGPHKHGMLFE
jgi:hypothetical protein